MRRKGMLVSAKATFLCCAVVIGLCSCHGRDSAVAELEKKNIPVNADGLAGSAAAGDVEAVKLLLEAGVSVNDKNSQGSTALIEAAWAGKERVVTVLLDEKAEVNTVSNKKFTSLLASIFQKHDEITLMLLNKGADPNVTDFNGVAPLMEPAWHGNEKILKALIEKGANVNYVRESDGATALKAALANHQDKIVDLLRLAGAKD